MTKRMGQQGTFHQHYCGNCGRAQMHGGPATSCQIEGGLRAPLVCRGCGQAGLARKAHPAERQRHHGKRRRGAYDRA